MRALLTLEDGAVFEGRSFGSKGEAYGEVVFNTSMTGYQEILTDPSYKGQIVAMTYPLIGNYGINSEDMESIKPQVEGFIVSEYSEYPSNWRSQGNLEEFLRKFNIMGVEGIDTRALTRHIRIHGAMKGVLSTIDLDEQSLVKKAKESPGLIGRDLVKEATCPKAYEWKEEPEGRMENGELKREEQEIFRVVVVDCGVKHNILRLLKASGCQVVVVPARTGAEKILEMNPQGILLSNGPGDPEGVPYLVETTRKLIGKKPIFGICLGHQILGLAFGGHTYKLKFGHRGGNQPVKNFETGRVEITVQNHGFAVDLDSIPDREVKLTHINLNDHTVEGMKHTRLPIFSVQYHPEASPGPQDSRYLFDRFIELMRECQGR